MYDELVKSIHCCFGFDSMQTDCENCMMKDKREEHNYVGCCDALGLAAADAIEALSRDLDSMNEANIALYGALPKWIPVEERLPKDFVSVQAHMVGADPFPTVREAYVIDREWFFPALHEFLPVDYWCEFDEPPKEE